jgi:hypothetical protein
MNERIKDKSPKSKFKPFRDADDRDVEEHQLIDIQTYPRDRYQDHILRVHALEKSTGIAAPAKESQANDSSRTELLSMEVLEERYCTDLKTFISAYGAGGKDEDDRRLLDLHWEIQDTYVTTTKAGGNRKMEKRVNVVTGKEKPVSDTGALWKEINKVAKKKHLMSSKDLNEVKDFIRSWYVLLLPDVYNIFYLTNLTYLIIWQSN